MISTSSEKATQRAEFAWTRWICSSCHTQACCIAEIKDIPSQERRYVNANSFYPDLLRGWPNSTTASSKLSFSKQNISKASCADNIASSFFIRVWDNVTDTCSTYWMKPGRPPAAPQWRISPAVPASKNGMPLCRPGEQKLSECGNVMTLRAKRESHLAVHCNVERSRQHHITLRKYRNRNKQTKCPARFETKSDIEINNTLGREELLQKGA